MAAEVRPVTESEVAAWVTCMKTGFLQRPAEGEAEYRRGGMELARTWGAFEHGQVVGALRSFATPLTVPGEGQVRAAALTNVAVAPTHRRQGLLSEMLTCDLRASADRGEAVGILIAAEYPIYGRFGYGPAVEGAGYSVDAALARFLGPAAGTVELVDLATMRQEAPAIYDRYRSGQPGAIERTPRWWDQHLEQVPVPGLEPGKGFQAVFRSSSGEPEGYLRYQAEDVWDQMRPKAVLTVDELVAVTPAAYRRLWQFCCEMDWVTTVKAGDRSVEEALAWLLIDGRAVSQTARFDFLWVRPLDVAAVLSARRYLTEGRVVLDVVDTMGLAGGRYLLDGGPSGATCARTDAAADLSLPVDALGAISLGGVSLSVLAAAGRVDEHRTGALALADAMFRSAVVPWCSTWF